MRSIHQATTHPLVLPKTQLLFPYKHLKQVVPSSHCWVWETCKMVDSSDSINTIPFGYNHHNTLSLWTSVGALTSKLNPSHLKPQLTSNWTPSSLEATMNRLNHGHTFISKKKKPTRWEWNFLSLFVQPRQELANPVPTEILYSKPQSSHVHFTHQVTDLTSTLICPTHVSAQRLTFCALHTLM